MGRRAWQATVHGVTKSWTRLSDFTSLHFTSLHFTSIHSSLGIESACSAGDLGLIPGLERSPGIPQTEEPGRLQSMGSQESDTT